MILAKPEQIELFTARGWWDSSTIDDLFCRWVDALGEQEAVVDPPNRESVCGGAPRRLSWNALAQEVGRMAGVLYGLGLRKDDAVLVQLPNCVEQYICYLACARLGIIVSPVPAQYREHELEYVLEQAQATVAICTVRIGKFAHANMLLGLHKQCAGLRHVLCFGEPVPEGAIALERAMAQTTNVAEAQSYAQSAGVTANDVFTLTWTSGTESSPKGVPRSANDWRIAGRSVVDAPQLKAGQRSLNPFPMVNQSGISSAFMAWLEAGLTVVQHHPFDIQVFLEQIRSEVIEYTVAPPAILNMLLQQPELLEGIRFDKLRSIGSGSAPLSEWMISEFDKRHGVKVHNFFGSSEGMCLPGTERDIPEPALRAAHFPRMGVAGFTWDAYCSDKIQTRLVDPQTEREITDAGVPGEMRVKGPTVLSAYWRAPELTARSFDEQGYYKTGDTFEIAGDRKQFYKYVGRFKDLVNRGGMNISPDEIESLLQAHPKVREVSVVGWPDERLGELVCACVVPAHGETLTLEELVAYLRDVRRVASFKLPERILLVDALPRNPVGKVLKRTLREQIRGLTDTA
ncbi:MAG: class I adenylate-forming enzyme family protein [Burkholderiaceae bacterium]